MNFWENVDDELKFRGMERKELGSLAGFPESYISKGIARQSCPSADLAIKIAHVLKVPVESLVNGFCESDKKRYEQENCKEDFVENMNKLQLYKKYHSIIETLEALPADKQQAAITIFEQCKILSRR